MTRWPTLIEEVFDGAPAVRVLDQTCLPAATVMRRLTTLQEAAVAIRDMQVRGAPLIGVTAAYGVALGLRDDVSDQRLQQVIEVLGATRPTAVNLQWALRRMQMVLGKSALVRRRDMAWAEARAIAEEDRRDNAVMGVHGAELLGALLRQDTPLQLMTHCNAGRLATVEYGTALSPIYELHRRGIPLHVWVSETRPRNQGLLTAWELAEAGIPHSLIVDNAAGLLMMRGQVDAVIVGADRIAANGDVANKVGTYLKALAARASGVPFYVAAPCSTIDYSCIRGTDIPIEERSGDELGAGEVPVYNPAFDITPAALVTALISERGIVVPALLAGWNTP